MKYRDIVNVDAHFQKSINIGLDLGKVDKINSYIPTSTGIEFLNHFITNVIEDNDEKTSMLVAPYGKGKSHSVLVLLSLLSSTNYDDYKQLLSKIRINSPELLKKIEIIKEKKYLPVIISNTRGSLNQSLMISLQKAIQTAGIKEILMKTDFEQAYDRIEEWKQRYPQTYNNFIDELKKRNISYDNFIEGLKDYDESKLKIFKNIHKNILSGADFVIQNTLEAVDYYHEVTLKLMEDYHYDGIYIVFDEFTKFLESRDPKTISNDMKIIQDLAELCNNSKDTNSFLQLILHKPISDYESLDQNIRNAYKGIEGRGTTYYFETNLTSSFDLIANVLQKNEKFKDYEKEQYKIFDKVKNDVLKLPLFNSEFDELYIEEKLIQGCFPLHPLAAYLLIKISEKVAQNERSLFTFLAQDTKNSLLNVINNGNDASFVDASIIFDYFESLFLEEKDNLNVQKTATKAISALNHISRDENEEITVKEKEEFIKALALLLIVNDSDSLPTNTRDLVMVTMFEEDKCEKVIEALKKDGVIVQRHDGNIYFKVNMDLSVEDSIKKQVSTKFVNVNVDKELKKIMGKEYYYPRTYNIVHFITRFCKIEYLSTKSFLALHDGNYFFDDLSDGLIINLIRGNEDESKEIQDKVSQMNNDRIVVVYPNEYRDYEKTIKNVLAVNNLLNDTEFISNNPLIKTELELMIDDLKNTLGDLLRQDYSFSKGDNHLFCSYNHDELNQKKSILSKNRILGNMLENSFNRYPDCFNLELINKNEVKGVYKKARKEVVNKILNNQINTENLGTSPEDTIISCILIETGILNGNANDKLIHVLSIIREFLENDKQDFENLYSILTKPPYGIRKGVIPILLAVEISKKKQCILLRFKGQEVETSGFYLELLNEKPSDFTFVIEKETESKRKYIEELGKLFNCDITTDMPKNYNSLATAIRHWYMSLPKFTKQMIGTAVTIKSKKYRMLRKNLNQSNINSSELVLSVIPKIIESNDYAVVIKELAKVKDTLDTFVENYLIELKAEINETLGFDKETYLNKAVNHWIDNNKNGLNKRVLNDSVKDFIETCQKSTSDSEDILTNKIAYCFTSFFVEDWSDITHDLFIKEISKLKEYEQQVETENRIFLQLDGKTYEKNIISELDDSADIVEDFIESTMNDFGDALSNEQKIALLAKIMKKYFE